MRTAKKSKGSAANSAAKKHGRWHTIGQWLLWIFTAITILGLLGACFGGYSHPSIAKGFSLLELTLPLWLFLWFLAMIFNVLWCRKAIVFCVLAFIACANAIWDYFPLNIFGPSEKKYAECPKFTLLTYNVSSFLTVDKSLKADCNPTLSYIIRKNADVVCLQEAEISLTKPVDVFKITREQIDTIHNLYPYRLIYGGYLTVLSKYPVEPIHTPPLTDDQKHKWTIYPIGVFRINIEGLPVTLFNVHLQSYGLSASDKELYKNIAEGREISEAAQDGSVRRALRQIKQQIYQKVQTAAVNRAREADVLCNYIKKFGGPNVIIAGDFNDVPGCYTLRKLDEYDMRQVYPELGFGPMITFNADMFYFRIDHILYRGALKPLKISRGSIKSSDHYPLEATFAITQE